MQGACLRSEPRRGCGDSIRTFYSPEGDHLFITATAEMLTQLLRNLGIITHKAKRVIICGGGRIGYYLSTWLAKEGVSVLLIEQDEARCEELSGKLPPEVCIIHGDASSQFLLESEGTMIVTPL